MSIRASAFVLVLCAAATGAFAQSVPPVSPERPAPLPRVTDQKACGPADRSTIGSGSTPQAAPNAGQDLSDKLARTDGVICPPANVDQDIQAPTPGGGSMPVIPPPGSPGGDPSVRPK